MVRIARRRVADLFGLAERESLAGHFDLADRYVALARRIGMRYNVRLLGEYRDFYCRSCSSYWVEGRSVRTRLRAGHRVRTCLRCGHQRRTRTVVRGSPSRATPEAPAPEVAREEGALSAPRADETDLADEETEDE